MNEASFHLHHHDFDYQPIPTYTLLIYKRRTTILQADSLAEVIPSFYADGGGHARAVFDGRGWCVASTNDTGMHMLTAAWIEQVAAMHRSGTFQLGDDADEFLLDTDLTFRHLAAIEGSDW